MPPRSSQKTKFGLTMMPNRYNNFRFPISSNRKLLINFEIRRNGNNNLLGNMVEDVIEEIEKIEDPQLTGGIVARDLSGSGLGETLSKVFEISKKISEGFTTAKKVGSAVVDIAGPVVSAVIESKSKKNPDFRPGFPGETHLVLPTKFGLTRANFCGPGTNIGARITRQDKGVDGPRGADIACRTHDFLYSQAKTKEDIRKADDILRQAISNSTAGPVTKKILRAGIKAKTLGEDVGLLSVSRFAPQIGQGRNSSSGSGRNVLVGSGGRLIESLPSRAMLRKRSIIKNDRGSMITRGITCFSGHTDRNGQLIVGKSGSVNLASQDLLNVDPNFLASQRGTGIVGVRSGPVRPSDTGVILRERGLISFQRGRGVANPSVVNPSGGGLLQDLTKQATGKIGKETIRKLTDVSLSVAKKVEKAIEGNPLVQEGLKRLPADKLRDIVLKQIKKSKKKKRISGSQKTQEGGQFATLASIAAGLLLPEVIKGVKKLVKKKKKKKK